MVSRRDVLGVALILPVVSLWPRRAAAGVARALPLSTMVQKSAYALIGTALEGTSRWENEGKQRRIVTYTRVRVEEPVAGSKPGSEVMVRTLGGRVGKVGQIVHGAATLTVGATAMLFLKPDSLGRDRVTAMAQGHFPVREDNAGSKRLYPSPRLSSLVGKTEQSAVAQLIKKPVPDATELVRKAWKRHAR